MARCRRINDNCENRRSIIIDTNALIHYTQYLSETKYSDTDYHEIFRDFRDLFNTIKMQCSYRKFFVSEKVLREEYHNTFIAEVKFLNELDYYYQTRFIDVIIHNLRTRNIHRNLLTALRPIADEYSRLRRSDHIDNRDLSLLLAALEELKDHPRWNFLIVTGDDSFRRFIPYIKNLNQITLAGTTYMTSNLNGTILLSPLNHTHTNDNTPYFEWGDIPEATDYIIQLDTSTTFNSVDYRYQKVNNNYWTASPFLQDNTWYWRVAGIDSKNDVGFFSAYNILYIDAPPGQSTLILPENNRYIATSNPTFTWSEAYNALNYTLQLDSSNTFSSGDLIIYSQILLTSYSPISPITDGIWYWRIQAFDNTGNSGPYSNVNLIIIDATIPSIDQPNDKSYKEGSTGNRIVWNSNDINPDRCEVTRDETIVRDNSWDGNIIIIDIDELSVGTYIYTCTVYDKAGNSNSDSVTVTVEEAENIFGLFIIASFIGIVMVIGIAMTFIIKKRRKIE